MSGRAAIRFDIGRVFGFGQDVIYLKRKCGAAVMEKKDSVRMDDAVEVWRTGRKTVYRINVEVLGAVFKSFFDACFYFLMQCIVWIFVSYFVFVIILALGIKIIIYR